MRNSFIKKLTITAIITALTFLTTFLIKFPGPIPPGYINLGDAIVIACALALDGRIAWVAGGIGSALADIALGGIIFAPFTFVIKSLEGIVVWVISRPASKMGKGGRATIMIAAAIAGAIVMVGGYFLAEWLLLKYLGSGFGMEAALAELPFNAIQGLFGAACGYGLALVLKRNAIQQLINGKSAV